MVKLCYSEPSSSFLVIPSHANLSVIPSERSESRNLFNKMI